MKIFVINQCHSLVYFPKQVRKWKQLRHKTAVQAKQLPSMTTGRLLAIEVVRLLLVFVPRALFDLISAILTRNSWDERRKWNYVKPWHIKWYSKMLSHNWTDWKEVKKKFQLKLSSLLHNGSTPVQTVCFPVSQKTDRYFLYLFSRSIGQIEQREVKLTITIFTITMLNEMKVRKMSLKLADAVWFLLSYLSFITTRSVSSCKRNQHNVDSWRR